MTNKQDTTSQLQRIRMTAEARKQVLRGMR